MTEVNDISDISLIKNFKIKIHEYRTSLTEVLCIDEFKRAALTYKSWINEIVNSFIIDSVTHKRLSNGFIEGKNNFCKVIKRIGFGYSDFDVFRYKIINSNRKNY